MVFPRYPHGCLTRIKAHQKQRLSCRPWYTNTTTAMYARKTRGVMIQHREKLRQHLYNSCTNTVRLYERLQTPIFRLESQKSTNQEVTDTAVQTTTFRGALDKIVTRFPLSARNLCFLGRQSMPGAWKIGHVHARVVCLVFTLRHVQTKHAQQGTKLFCATCQRRSVARGGMVPGFRTSLKFHLARSVSHKL